MRWRQRWRYGMSSDLHCGDRLSQLWTETELEPLVSLWSQRNANPKKWSNPLCLKKRANFGKLKFQQASTHFQQEALLSQRGRAMLRVCISSIQNVDRSLLLLVVSASDIPLRTTKLFSVLFSSAYSSMLQAVTNKYSLVRRDRAIYTAWSSVTVFVTS